MLHANFTALCVVKTQFLPIEISHRGNKNFGAFCSGDLDLDLDSMTFIYALDLYSLEM